MDPSYDSIEAKAMLEQAHTDAQHNMKESTAMTEFDISLHYYINKTLFSS